MYIILWVRVAIEELFLFLISGYRYSILTSSTRAKAQNLYVMSAHLSLTRMSLKDPLMLTTTVHQKYPAIRFTWDLHANGILQQKTNCPSLLLSRVSGFRALSIQWAYLPLFISSNDYVSICTESTQCIVNNIIFMPAKHFMALLLNYLLNDISMAR